MKRLIFSAIAIAGLAGCVAVPAPYYGDAYYYPAPAVGVGIYSGPSFHHGRHHRHHRHRHRHHRH